MAIAGGGQRPRMFLWIKQLLLTAGFLMLMVEVRFEHREVVGEEWRGWIPIVYSGLMLIFVPLGTALFQRGGKKLLLALYGCGVVIGLIGVWLHADGHLLERVGEILAVWQHLVNKIDHNAPFHPPVLAPLAFVGLASIGIVLTLEDSDH
jgi:hypothetical protein